MGRLIDLTGKRFGRLVVLKYHGSRDRRPLWLCLCDCQNEKVVLGESLRGGVTNSCGCLVKEKVVERCTKHGHARRKQESSEHNSWSLMISRCTNPNHPRFVDYGGRGIKVCERWLNSFEAFLDDMGFKPTPQHSIERLDNDGNYEPDNCKWATVLEQNVNQRIRRDNSTGHKGVYLHKRTRKWQANIGYGGKLIYLGLFDTKEEAISARKRAEIEFRQKSS